jgi:hypothetical protein
MAIKPNDLVGGYHFVQKIGEGPTATVWLAREKDTHLLVAIKLIKPEKFPPSALQLMYERLVESLGSAGRLTHPHLALVRSTFHQPRLNMYGVVSEYLDGQTLDGIYIPKTIDGRPGTMEPHTMAGVLAWFQQVATVLAFLHANGVVHGRLKPTNVMLMTGYERPTIKVLDTCWAAARIDPRTPDDDRFRAPEVVDGAEPTPESDQWSAARVLHQLIVSSAPGPQMEALATAPIALLKVVQRALQKDPAQRFNDTGGFYYAIESVRHHLDDLAGEEAKARGDSRASNWEEQKHQSPTVATVVDREDHTPAERSDTLPLKAKRSFDAEIASDESGLAVAYDDVLGSEDLERPPRNWMAGVGIGALGLAVGVIVVAGWMFSHKEVVLADAKTSSSALSKRVEKDTRLGPKPVADPSASSSAARSRTATAAREVVKVETAKAREPVKPAQPVKSVEPIQSVDPQRSNERPADLGSRVGKADPSPEPNRSGAVESRADQIAALERSCNQGKLSTCIKAGDMLAKDGTLASGKRARHVYEAACDRQVAVGCEQLARLYAEGIGGPANERVAKAFHTRACGFGLKDACDK